MKKKLFSVAAMLFAMVGLGMSAQEPVQVVEEVTEVVNTQSANVADKAKANNDGFRKDKSARHNGECKEFGKGNKNARHHGPHRNFFEGLNLTPDQQSQLDALRPRRQDCQNCDTAANGQCDRKKGVCNGGKFQPRHDGSRRGMPAEYVGKVKEILTPEQYVQFLENIVIAPAPGQRQECPEGNGCPAVK